MRALHAGLVAASVTGFVSLLAMTTSTTGCSSASEVRGVFMALDAAGNRPRNQFFTDSELIYCDVVFSGYSVDQTLDVQFVQTTGETPIYSGDGQLHQVSRLWAAGEDAPSTGVQTLGFSMNPPQALDGGQQFPYPVGHYKCLVTVNGQSAGSADFDVNYPNPDCPASGGAYDGMSCVAYQLGAKCPNDSNFNPTGTDCTCQSSTPDPTTRTFSCP